MTAITLQGGKVVLRDGKVGTEQACCCQVFCPPGSDCCATAEYLLEYCEEVNGEWVITGTNDPCECDAAFTQTEQIDTELFPGSGIPIRILRCFVRDCDAVGDNCCAVPTPEECLGAGEGQWPGGRFEHIPFEFEFFQIGCYENPLP